MKKYNKYFYNSDGSKKVLEVVQLPSEIAAQLNSQFVHTNIKYEEVEQVKASVVDTEVAEVAEVPKPETK